MELNQYISTYSDLMMYSVDVSIYGWNHEAPTFVEIDGFIHNVLERQLPWKVAARKDF